MGVDKAAGEGGQVGSGITKILWVWFGGVRRRDATNAEVELHGPTLCMQEVPESLDRAGLLLRRHALEVQGTCTDDDARGTAAKANDPFLDGGDLIAKDRPTEQFDHRCLSVGA